MKAMRERGELKGGGQVPQLHIGDQVLSQSNAIATYCSKLAGLYPSDPLAAARVDEIIQFITEDVRSRCIYPTMRVDDADEKAKKRKKLAEEQLPEKFTLLEAMMDATYCCGDALTLADFYVYGLLNWIGMNTLDGVPHTIILECSSASFDTLRASRRWRSGRRDAVDVLYAQVQEAYQARSHAEQSPQDQGVERSKKSKTTLVRAGELAAAPNRVYKQFYVNW